MKHEPCTYSPESVEDYSLTSSSDIRQLSLLSGSHTPAKSCANEPLTDGSQSCMCGKGTLDCSIHPSTPESWIASMQDSLAKTLASLESRQVYLREPDQVFTEKSCGLLTLLDQSSSTWKTLQQSLVTDSEPYSQTWPRWGMTVGGSAYAHPMSERRITETDGFCWQTPVADDSVNREKGKFNSRGEPKLSAQVKYWPTPTAHNAKETNAPSESNRNTPTLAAQVGGQLNPDWVGWLMGFPIAWASSKATETRKSRCKLPQHTDCLEVSE